MSSSRLIALLACAFLMACQIDFNADIPCQDDSNCPTKQVCNLDFFRCVDGEGGGEDVDPGDTDEDVADVVEDVTDVGDVEDLDTPDVGEEVGDADDVDDVEDDAGDADDVGQDVEDTDVLDEEVCVYEGEEVCDGVDNDCNGIIDDPPVCGAGTCGEGMRLVNRADGTRFCIDTYEASREDATEHDEGTLAREAFSRANVLPWSNATFANATSACENAGKRLCTSFEWQTACFGDTSDPYPYGRVYERNTCNGTQTTLFDGSAPTGHFEDCISRDGVFDMSGNLREWTRSTSGTGNELFGGSYMDPQLNLRCSSREVDTSGGTQEFYGFRCCSDAPE